MTEAELDEWEAEARGDCMRRDCYCPSSRVQVLAVEVRRLRDLIERMAIAAAGIGGK